MIKSSKPSTITSFLPSALIILFEAFSRITVAFTTALFCSSLSNFSLHQVKTTAKANNQNNKKDGLLWKIIAVIFFIFIGVSIYSIYNSKEVRYNILKGLLDTDGSVHSTGKPEFYTIS